MSAFDWLARLSEKIARWVRRPRTPEPPRRAEPPKPEQAARELPRGKSRAAFNIPANPWPDLGKPIDANLRLAVSLVGWGDSIQLFQRTGVQIVDDEHHEVGMQFLPLILEFARPLHDIDARTLAAWRDALNLDVPDLYLEEGERNPALTHATARLTLSDKAVNGDAPDMQEAILRVFKEDLIRNVSLATLFQPCLEASCTAMNVPPDRVFRGRHLDGSGVIVGVVDDGCALAHWDFMKPQRPATPPETRLLYLWDQSSKLKDTARGWRPVTVSVATGAVTRGYDIAKLDIDNGINQPGHVGGASGDVIDSARVHAYLGYEVVETTSHGTHVMDIAAGNGQSLMGSMGVAPNADIIFVQLPTDAIVAGGATLGDRILEGVTYIFNQASRLRRKCVVNVSFGSYAGPHDGTSMVEKAIDQLLALPDRAVVVAAGNGFEANCHAYGTLTPAHPTETRRWLVLPEDPTLNTLEVWYNGDATLDVSVAPPDATISPVTAHLGDHLSILRASDSKSVGWIDHQNSATGNGDRCVTIHLRPTIADPINAPAPPGTWGIVLTLVGNVHAHYHAWIERDDAGRARQARRRQSHFHEEDAHPGYSVANLATGLHTVAVGAYNTASDEVCRYSACGPTRKTHSGIPEREKPEVIAPAEELALGRGVLCASSGRARPTRMGGTSAAAPHVSGLIALMFQFAGRSLTATDIQRILRDGAKSHPLHYNTHQKVDVHQRVKQQMVWGDLIGHGRVDAVKTIDQI
jgi:subtilisin family serine protease